MSDPFGDSDSNPFFETKSSEPAINEDEVFGGGAEDTHIDPKASVAATKTIGFETPTGSLVSSPSTLPNINMKPAASAPPPRPPKPAKIPESDEVSFEDEQAGDDRPTEGSLFGDEAEKKAAKASYAPRKSRLFDFFSGKEEGNDDGGDDGGEGKPKEGNSEDPDAPADGGKPEKEERHWYHFWKPSFYRIYFDVDTTDVMRRFLAGLVPIGQPFFERVKENPDFYGPLWITTTILFLLAICSNFASYIAYLNAGEERHWDYSFGKLSAAAGVLYGFLIFVPLLLWVLLRFVVGSQVKYIQTSCVYGYSLAAFIVATPLCIIPSEWARWIAIIIAAVDSCITLTISQWKFGAENRSRTLIPIIVGLLALVGLSFTYKLYFFAPIKVPHFSSSSEKFI